MKHRKLILTLAFFLFIFFLALKPVSASEGVVELRSTIGKQSRCFALSAYMKDGEYHLLITCRDIIYPADPNVLTYLLWATPKEEGKPIKLGALGVGKLEAQSKKPFVALFATKEVNSKVKEPTGPVVMRGNLRLMGFLENVPGFPSIVEEQKKVEEAIEKGELPEEIQKQEAEAPQKENRLKTLLKGAAFLPLLAIFAIVFFILFLVRRR